MEMKIDADRVKSERDKRAWSQTHLAEVANLGLRTIQRIETTGSASFESVQALASVFSIDISDLLVQKGNHPTSPRSWGWITSGVAAAIAAIALTVTTTAQAEQVMLELSISAGAEHQAKGHLLVAEGKDAEMRIDDVVRFIVVPTITDEGKVLLRTRVYEFDGSDYILLDEPKLITANHKEAEIRISSDRGNDYRFLITPRK